jgi:hypothetical protein
MSRDYTLIAFRAFAGVFAVNRTNVASADSGTFRTNQNLPVSRHRNREIFELNSAVSG